MNKERIKYAITQALSFGIYFTICFFLIDTFVYHKPLQIRNILFNVVFFIFAYFIWGYFQYKKFLKQQQEREDFLKPKQFRCFKCENLILPDEQKCSKCGWTWNK